MAQMHQADVLRNYKFKVVFDTDIGSGSDATATLGFQTVSGLGHESEVIEYREGTNVSWMAKMPGQVSVGDVTFERGVASNKLSGDALMQWRTDVKMIMENPLNTTETLRRTITIYVAKENNPDFGSPANRVAYTLYNCWPSALEIGDLDATSSEVLIESCTVVAESLLFGE